MIVSRLHKYVTSLLLLAGTLSGCVRSDTRNDAGTVDDSKTPVAEAESPASVDPLHEPPATDGVEGDKPVSPSVLDALVSKDTTWGVFSDEEGLMAISSTGEMARLYDEPFNWLRIDYELGLLWLNRSWSDPQQPGLFIADLRKPTIVPVRVAHLKRGFRVSRGGTVSISMDAHAAPYHVYSIEVDVAAADIQIKSRSEYVGCKDECMVDQDAVELLREVRQKPLLFESATPLDTTKYTTIARHATCPNCGRFVALPDTTIGLISVAFTDHPGEVGWQIYDPQTDEFISDLTFQRSKLPHPEGEYANYIMICKGGKALVVEGQFVTGELKPLGPGTLSQGVCLNGGTSFIDG